MPLLLWVGARLWIEWQWFGQFQLASVLLRRWLLQLVAGGAGLLLGMALQRWLGWIWSLPGGDPRRMALRPLAYGLSLLALLAGQVLPTLLLTALARTVLIDPFGQGRLHGLIRLADIPPPLGITLLLVAAALLILRPIQASRLLAALAALATATVLARGWGLWSMSALAPDKGIREPLLGADISFTLVRFPALALGLTLMVCLTLTTLSAALWGLLARPPQLSDGRFAGLSPRQLRALRAPVGLLLLLAAAAFWLGRHQLLLSTVGSVPGAGWIDVHLSLPMRTGAGLLALITGLLVLLPLPRRGLRARAVILTGTCLVVVPILEALLLPIMQLLIVKPRELERELPYLARSIRATRQAFQLDRISARNVNPNPRLSRSDVLASQATIRNIRLWDSQPLQATNRQLQRLRVFYNFSEPAVDRYDLGQDPVLGPQQVMITAREMDTSKLPEAARTWLNRHLVFTHGQGFTVAPVNTSGPDGLPEYFISDVGSPPRIAGSAPLAISREMVERGIPIGNWSLYFGALPLPYALAPTDVEEFDYPQGDENFYTNYRGRAGVHLGNTPARLAAALYLGEPRLFVRGALNAETRLLLRREVRQRLRALAPFLHTDSEPYLVSVQQERAGTFPADQHQFWIVEGYTVSRTYPYSAAVPGHPDIRYLRNAVKAVVDAHNGKVTLYVNEEADPIIRGWQRLFPELFRPIAAMDPALRRHIRYPTHQFEIQTSQLLRYHVTDPRVFYSGDDVWQVPLELYGRRQVPVRPYHVIAQLTPDQPAEFLLLQPLTPLARPNLVAWLAARSDGESYGELVLLRFPSQTPIFGPEQMTALINQNPVISQQFGLWDRSGSEVIQGNLLVVPIGEALLYVEPVYLKAREGGLPTLTRVVVSDGTRITMQRTLEEGIEALLEPGSPSLPVLSGTEAMEPRAPVVPLESPAGGAGAGSQPADAVP